MSVGKFLVVFGLAVAAVGFLLILAGRIPWVGRLPGDIYVQRGNWTFYFPVATGLLISAVLTLIFWGLGARK